MTTEEQEIRALELLKRLSRMPLATEATRQTWNPPEWEEIVGWWDQFVGEARAITGKTYRSTEK